MAATSAPINQTGPLQSLRAAFTSGLLLRNSSPGERTQICFLCAIVLISLAMRFAVIGHSPLDRTMWKEIDYIELSRNFWQHGFHFFQPEISWPARAPRVTAMELPLVPFSAAALYSLFGFHLLTVRALPVVGFLILTLYEFLLVRAVAGPVLGLLSALAVALMPIHDGFGRALFSDPFAVALIVGTLYHFDQWTRKCRTGSLVAAGICFTLAVALKLEPLYLLPLLGCLCFSRFRFTRKRWLSFGVFVVGSLLLPLAWYLYAFHLSRTSIDVFGVVPFLQGHNKLQTLTMIREPRRFWLALGHRIWNLAWGVCGSPFVLIGLIVFWPVRQLLLFRLYLAAIAAYFLLVAEGNIDAPYRQFNALPVLSFLIAAGVLAIIEIAFRMNHRPPPISALAATASLLLLAISLPSWVTLLRADPLLPAHPKAWALAQAIRGHRLPGDNLIMIGEYSQHVGGNDLSPVLSYYSGVRGWNLQPRDWSINRIDSLRAEGATLAAVDDEFDFDWREQPASRTLVQALCATYPVLYARDGALLLSLRTRSKDGQGSASATDR